MDWNRHYDETTAPLHLPTRTPPGPPRPLTALPSGPLPASLPLVRSRRPQLRSGLCPSAGSARPGLRRCCGAESAGPAGASARALLHLLRGWAALRAEEAPSLRPPSTSHHSGLPPLRPTACTGAAARPRARAKARLPSRPMHCPAAGTAGSSRHRAAPLGPPLAGGTGAASANQPQRGRFSVPAPCHGHRYLV